MQRKHRSLRFVSAWLIGSAAIAWALVALPFSAAPSSANMIDAGGPSALISTTIISNAARKGDRLDRGGNLRRSQPATTSGRKMPVGCEAAFSKLAGSRNSSMRCIASVDHPSKLANAYTDDQT